MTETKAPEGGWPVSEMQRKIAQAIYEGRNGARCKPWAHQPKVHREPYLLDALAAMKAMREPTPEMKKIGEQYTGFPVSIWRVMLDTEISIAEGGKDGD